MNRNCRRKTEKVYVKVTSDFDATGYCYTVMIKGQERCLFFERSDPRFPSRFGRWFVEVETK